MQKGACIFSCLFNASENITKWFSKWAFGDLLRILLTQKKKTHAEWHLNLVASLLTKWGQSNSLLLWKVSRVRLDLYIFEIQRESSFRS